MENRQSLCVGVQVKVISKTWWLLRLNTSLTFGSDRILKFVWNFPVNFGTGMVFFSADTVIILTNKYTEKISYGARGL